MSTLFLSIADRFDSDISVSVNNKSLLSIANKLRYWDEKKKRRLRLPSLFISQMPRVKIIPLITLRTLPRTWQIRREIYVEL